MIRFKLSTLLLITLIAALTLGLVVTFQQIASLKRELQAHKEQHYAAIQTSQYGYANLDLLRVHPDVWTDDTCGPYFQHELAVSLHWHWERRNEIDEALPYPDGSMAFAEQAVQWLEVRNLNDFLKKADSLCIYPDDALGFIESELTEENRKSFDQFIRDAAGNEEQRSIEPNAQIRDLPELTSFAAARWFATLSE